MLNFPKQFNAMPYVPANFDVSPVPLNAALGIDVATARALSAATTANINRLIAAAIKRGDKKVTLPRGTYMLKFGALPDFTSYHASTTNIYRALKVSLHDTGAHTGSKNITGVTRGTTTLLTVVAHGKAHGSELDVSGIVGTTQLNGQRYIGRVVDANTLELCDGNCQPINSSGYTAYVSGGVVEEPVFLPLDLTIDGDDVTFVADEPPVAGDGKYYMIATDMKYLKRGKLVVGEGITFDFSDAYCTEFQRYGIGAWGIDVLDDRSRKMSSGARGGFGCTLQGFNLYKPPSRPDHYNIVQCVNCGYGVRVAGGDITVDTATEFIDFDKPIDLVTLGLITGLNGVSEAQLIDLGAVKDAVIEGIYVNGFKQPIGIYNKSGWTNWADFRRYAPTAANYTSGRGEYQKSAPVGKTEIGFIVGTCSSDADGSGTSILVGNNNNSDAFAISAITQANPGVFTSAVHGLPIGTEIAIAGVVGMTQVNGNIYEMRPITATTFSVVDRVTGVALNTTGFGAYVSGGTFGFALNVSQYVSCPKIDLTGANPIRIKECKGFDFPDVRLTSPVVGDSSSSDCYAVQIASSTAHAHNEVFSKCSGQIGLEVTGSKGGGMYIETPENVDVLKCVVNGFNIGGTVNGRYGIEITNIGRKVGKVTLAGIDISNGGASARGGRTVGHANGLGSLHRKDMPRIDIATVTGTPWVLDDTITPYVFPREKPWSRSNISSTSASASYMVEATPLNEGAVYCQGWVAPLTAIVGDAVNYGNIQMRRERNGTGTQLGSLVAFGNAAVVANNSVVAPGWSGSTDFVGGTDALVFRYSKVASGQALPEISFSYAMFRYATK